MKIFIVVFSLFLSSCSLFTRPNIISNNMYYQTDYNYFCLEEGKTWSQIVVCLNAEGNAERAQNKITNDLLDQN